MSDGTKSKAKGVPGRLKRTPEQLAQKRIPRRKVDPNAPKLPPGMKPTAGPNKDPDELTSLEKLFVEEYLVDTNKKWAYIRAGGAEAQAGVNSNIMFNRPRVYNTIQERMKTRSAKYEVTQARIIRHLALMAFGDRRALYEFNDGDGVTVKSSEDITDDEAAMIQNVHEVMGKHGSVVKIETVDAKGCLELLGRHLGMWNDKLQLTSLTAEQLANLSDEEIAMAVAVAEKLSAALQAKR